MSKEYDPILDPDFVGYNCKDPEESENFGIIENVADYAEEYFPLILDSLPSQLKEKATELGLLKIPKVSEKSFKKWGDDVCLFFKKVGIKWIFVREELPQDDFGSQFYYVSFPEEKMICSFYLPSDEDIRGIVYLTKGHEKCKPKMIPMPDEFEDDLDEDIDSFDEEYFDEEDDGGAYWESAWKGKLK